MIPWKTLRFGLWLPLLVSGARAQEQAPLGAGTDALGAHEMKLVAYVKPSEERSKSLEAEWAAARSATEFPMEWIDDFAQARRCPEFAPEAYPVVRLLRGEEPVADYTGPRTSDEILLFISRAKRSSQILTKLATAEEAESFASADDFVCVAHLDPSETAVREAFAAVAEKYWTEFAFGVVDAPGATEARVVCRKRDDGSAHTWSSATDSGLEGWVLEASRPVIAELTPANHQRFLDRGWPMVYILSPSASQRAGIRAQLRDFARGHYASLTCVTADPAYFPDLPARLGLLEDGAEAEYPAGAVHQLSTGLVYPYPRELQAWGLDVWQGRVRPWTPPGQEPPKENQGGSGGNVRIVRSHNLKVKNIPGLKIKIGGRERDEL